jgi:hypothetical protein
MNKWKREKGTRSIEGMKKDYGGGRISRIKRFLFLFVMHKKSKVIPWFM